MLSQALAREALLRPTAGQFASRVYAACDPVPLVLSKAAAGARGGGEVTHRVRPAVSAPAVAAQTATEGAFWRHGWTRRATSDPPEAHRHRASLLMGLAAGFGLVPPRSWVSRGPVWSVRVAERCWLARCRPRPLVRPDPRPPLPCLRTGHRCRTCRAGPTNAESGPPVLADLDATRARAYQGGDAALLQSAYAPGAPAGDRDARSLAALIETTAVSRA